MKIGLVSPRYPPTVTGGGEISLALLAGQLQARDHEVEVFSFDGGHKTEVDGIQVSRFRKLPHGLLEASNAYATLTLSRRANYLRTFDVLHGYNVTLTPALGAVASSLSVPSVATLNSYDVLPKHSFGVTPTLRRRIYETVAFPTTGRLLRRAMQDVDRFIALSEATRELYQEQGFDANPFDVVPNMLDPSFEVPEPTSAFDPDNITVLYVGSLIPEKGVKYFIKSFKHLPAHFSGKIVGDGPEGENLECLASDIGVDSRIDFDGQLRYDQVLTAYVDADIFIHPGVWPEPFGRTLLEAMEAGLPVVATNIGGPAEIVPQSELRPAPADPGALAEAIQNAADRPEIGAGNRRYVRDRFTPSKVVSQVLSVYKRAIADTN